MVWLDKIFIINSIITVISILPLIFIIILIKKTYRGLSMDRENDALSPSTFQAEPLIEHDNIIHVTDDLNPDSGKFSIYESSVNEFSGEENQIDLNNEQDHQQVLSHVVIKEYAPALKGIFESKLRLYNKNKSRILNLVLPFFRFDNNEISRFLINNKKIVLLEELYELWKLGYHDSSLAWPLVSYFFSINHPNSRKILFEILTYKQMNMNHRVVLEFLFQDILKKTITIDQFNNSYREDAAIWIFEVSLRIYFNKKPITRSNLKKWLGEMERLNEEKSSLPFVEFYNKELFEKSSVLLKFYLLKRFQLYNLPLWKELVFKQVFYYGSYKKLNLFSFQAPEFILIKNARNQKWSHEEWKVVIKKLKEHPFAPLHTFRLALKQKSDFLNTFTIDKETLATYIKHLSENVKSRLYMPPKMKFYLFLYFLHKEDWNNMAYVYTHLGVQAEKHIPKLYYARSFFKRKMYEKAYELISELIEKENKNIVSLNEAAIYATYAGKMEHAELIFTRLRKLFPENSQVLINESIYLKRRALKIAAESEIFTVTEKIA